MARGGFAIVAAAVAFGWSLSLPKRYTAVSQLYFHTSTLGQQVFGSVVAGSQETPTELAATHLKLVGLADVAAQAAATVQHVSTAQVQKEVAVIAEGQSDLVSVAVTDRSPQRATAIANAYAEAFAQRRREIDQATIMRAEQVVAESLAALPPAQRAGSAGQTLRDRVSQLQTLAALQTGNVEVAQQAATPENPSSPHPTRTAFVAGLLALILGFMVAIARDRFDQRVRDVDELEAIYGRPVLGTVPDEEAAPGTLLLDAFAAREAFSLLRANLRYFYMDNPVTVLAVMSPESGDGKTTVAGTSPQPPVRGATECSC